MVDVPVTDPLTQAAIAGDYERETGAAIARTFAHIDPAAMPAVLVACHGPFTWGGDAAAAAEHAGLLEYVARMASATFAIARRGRRPWSSRCWTSIFCASTGRPPITARPAPCALRTGEETMTNRKKMTFGVIVGNRNFFPAALAKAGREDMLRVLGRKGFDVVVLSPEQIQLRRGRDPGRLQALRRPLQEEPRPDRRGHRHPAEFRR